MDHDPNGPHVPFVNPFVRQFEYLHPAKQKIRDGPLEWRRCKTGCHWRIYGPWTRYRLVLSRVPLLRSEPAGLNMKHRSCNKGFEIICKARICCGWNCKTGYLSSNKFQAPYSWNPIFAECILFRTTQTMVPMHYRANNPSPNAKISLGQWEFIIQVQIPNCFCWWKGDFIRKLLTVSNSII